MGMDRTGERGRSPCGGTVWPLFILLLAAALALTGTAPASGSVVVAAPSGSVVVADSPTAAGQPTAFRGLTLTEALLKLQERGLEIVFTSELVRPEMRVEAEPEARQPRRILDEILAPHGLRVTAGAGGLLIVVPAAAPGHAIAGRVRSLETGEPLAGVEVRVLETGREALSDADGAFEIGPLDPGAYTLEAHREEYYPQRVEGVAVGAGGAAAVELSLQPVPFIRDEIVVSPSRLTLLDEEPVAPLSLSREEIEALPHLGGDLFRAFSLLPGIAGNDVSAQFRIHGGRSDEVQVLLDGQELYEAYHLQDFERGLSVVAPGGLAGASLTTGAFPVTYGDRMSGVLDMRTVTPPAAGQTRLSLSLLSAVAASGGTFGGGRGSWLASARRGSIDLANRIFGKEDPEFWDLFGKVGYQLGGRQHLRANLLTASDSLGFREEVDGEEKLFDTDYDTSYLWLTHQATVGQRLLVETTASFSHIDRDRRGLEDEEEKSFQVVDERDFDVVGLAQDWDFQAAPRHTVKAGFDVRRYEAAYDYFNRLEPSLVLVTDLTIPRSTLTRFEDRFSGDHLGAYVADRFSPLERLTLELGLRYDRHTLTGDTLVSPRVNAAVRLGPASVLRLAWGHFHQSHRPYELQVEDGEPRFFQAERSEHWVVGYERLFGRRDASPLHALRIEAYRRQIDDPRPRFENLFEPVNVFPEGEHDRVRIAPESSRAEGIEVTVLGRVGPRVDWWVNYAWASAEDRLSGRQVRRQIDQPHTLNLFLSSRWGEHWSLSLAWRFHTGWPTTPVSLGVVEDAEGEEELAPVLGPLNSDRLPDYHRLDLRASRQWPLRRGRLTFFIDLQNLYDRKNVAGFDLGIDDEAEELVIQPENWPGLFPSVGLRWEL